LVTRIDPEVVSLVAELRGHERQADGELERWNTVVEERKPPDASPAAITLATLRNDQELDSWEKRAGEREIVGRGRPGGSDVASPPTGCGPWSTCPSIPRQCRGPRRQPPGA
jgi:hypothetical protein